ncbi:MAG: hypothetical protein US31_C0002G0076 [Berkelbacteria bacterium GW2011_GWA1_36_9]|uniref:Uncharacterized protein n=1 Tax=Berkelbacteria bacterium GW2011_GWA1_36_9 TaxID=1618331 RepID=A0A0G0IRV3_9BACT|nr:MAG: hypothetical protein US31_C0002G0076 [Berkelbacteria bacterium GW2011_GWA1_36_9]
MSEKYGPCLEKNCSWCCDPVKVVNSFPEEKIPINKNGEKIWKERNGMWVPETHSDTVRLKIYDCINFDKQSGQCKFYEERPEICKNTSCVKDDSLEDIHQQHQKFINEKFIPIKKGKYLR